MLVSSNKALGFTLIELLVVLAIVAAIGGLTGPDLWQSYQRANERLVVIDYGRDLTGMRRDLMRAKRSMTLAENALSFGVDDTRLPSLPVGWAISANDDMVFLPTGVTDGGSIEMESPTGRLWRLRLAVLDGKIGVDLL